MHARVADAFVIPDRLPRLGRGRHSPAGDVMCAMEAASWLAGERWSDHPRAVHPVIARVARATNDALDDLDRQGLWPLIVDSVGTARRKAGLSSRLECWLRPPKMPRDGHELRGLWEILLAEYGRANGDGPPGTPAAPPESRVGDARHTGRDWVLRPIRRSRGRLQ